MNKESKLQIVSKENRVISIASENKTHRDSRLNG